MDSCRVKGRRESSAELSFDLQKKIVFNINLLMTGSLNLKIKKNIDGEICVKP